MSQPLQFPQTGPYPPFNLGDASPESPSSLSMRSLGRPAEAGIRPFAQYASLSGLGAGPREGVGDDVQAFASGPGNQGFLQTQGQHPGLHPVMSQFISDQVAPWNPLRANADPIIYGDPGRQSGSSSSFGQSFPNFSGYRSAAPPSEADTAVSRSIGGILSDSGYGSMARQSVGNPSVCGGDLDQSMETQSLIMRFQWAMVARGSMASEEELQKREQVGRKPAPANPGSGKLTCPQCNTRVKTNSELKKHEARHNKPYKCHVRDCPRATDGFSTNNDLDRHLRCVHKVLGANVVVYRCHLEQCREKSKDWPRADNFRQHLKRKHNKGDVDLREFEYRLSSLPGPACPETSEEITGETDMGAGVNPISLLSWAGVGQGGNVPSGLGDEGANRDGLVQTSTQDSGRTSTMEEGVSCPLRTPDAPQYQVQHTPHSVCPPSSLGPESCERSLPQVPQPDVQSASREPSPPADRSSCIGPDMLGHAAAGNSGFLQPQDLVVPREPSVHLDAGSFSGVLEEARSDYQDAEQSASTKESVYDESVQVTVSEDGLNETDSEDDALPADPGDVQSESVAGGRDMETEPNLAEGQTCPDIPKPMDLDDETEVSAFVQALIDKGVLEKILVKVGYQKAGDAMTQGQQSSPVSSVTREPRQNYRCDAQGCLKQFPRRSELKKHQKRHEKPYACTFPRCDKKFGSKNDWKRHENSQHFQLEIWRCAEKTADRPDGECGKVCHRRESLKAHLERDHGIHDAVALDAKLADCRMGRNFESRFWCGFCQKTIEPSGKGGPAHSERFDHIDDHFNGRNGFPKANIKDWVHVDTDPLPLPLPDASAKSRKRPCNPGGEDSRAKRPRNGGVGSGGGSSRSSSRERFWTCCACGNYWSMHTTSRCMDPCNHIYCDGCDEFVNENVDVDDAPMT